VRAASLAKEVLVLETTATFVISIVGNGYYPGRELDDDPN